MSTNPLQNLAQPSRIQQMMRNCGTAVQNLVYSMSQNHSALKTNILVVSSLILVISRIVISQASARGAKGTPNEHFRYRESIRTLIREAAGWTLSFLLLRSIENGIKFGLRQLFEINLNPARETLLKGAEKLINTHDLKTVGVIQTVKNVAAQIKAYATGQVLPAIQKETRPYYANQFFRFNPQNEYYNIFKGFIGLFSSSRNLSAQEQMKNFYEWFPILVGSVPAIGMSGYALERFNLDYSQPIIDALAARKKKTANLPMTQTMGLPSIPPTLQPPSVKTPTFADGYNAPLQAAPRFNQFINRVQTQQFERRVFP